jgi:regulatory protein
MVVTGIERQKRHRERVNIYIDGQFAFGLHAEVLLKYGLRKGDELDERTLGAITAEEEGNLAKRHALRLLSYRMRSEQELRTRLREKEFPPLTIDGVISHLRTAGLIDDRAFARSFIHDEQMRKPTGHRLLERQLRQKGIAPEIIGEALTELGVLAGEEVIALAAARKILARRTASRKQVDPRAQQKRIADFLTRRGYAWPVVSAVLRTMFTESAPLGEVD